VARLTSEQRLRDLHQALTRAAGELDDVRARLRGEVEGSVEYWAGNAADTFRNHAGAHHRIHHLTVARRRLLEAASLALTAANEAAAIQAGTTAGGDGSGGLCRAHR
jgi:uncharacterized protein YukE